MSPAAISLARAAVLLAGCAAVTGCGLFPKDRLDEAARSVPEARVHALSHLSDLTADEREAIRSREPTVGHANFVEYYFWWADAAGRPVATVVASPPPCRPLSARRAGGG